MVSTCPLGNVGHAGCDAHTNNVAENQRQPGTKEGGPKRHVFWCVDRVIYVEISTDCAKSNYAGVDQGKERAAVGSDYPGRALGNHRMVEILPSGTYQDEKRDHLRDEGVSFKSVDNGYTERGNQADTQRGNDTTDGDVQATAIDGRYDLTGDNTPENAKPDLLDQIQDADEFRRPITHEIATQNLFEGKSNQQMKSISSPRPVAEGVRMGISVARSWLLLCTYHGSIPTLRPERGRVRWSARAKRTGENDNADGIRPPEIEHQRAKESGDDVVRHQVDAEPQEKHLQVTTASASMLVFRQHSRNSSRFQTRQAFDFVVPFAHSAREEDGCWVRIWGNTIVV